VTLIIGVLCSDGVVMGADGAATLGNLGHSTVLQPVKKLNKIDNSVIIATSGAVGLGQRIGGSVNRHWTSGQLRTLPSFDFMTQVRELIGPPLVREMEYAAQAAKVLGMGVASQSAIALTMLAAPIENQIRLYQFDQTGAPEEATEHLPFIAIGSGQPLADPFLAFLRQIFWKDSIPNLSEGVLATVWSLQHAIRTNTGGVAEPIQLMTLQKDGHGTPVIKEFESAELAEHVEAVKAAELHLGAFRDKQPEQPPTTPPTPAAT